MNRRNTQYCKPTGFSLVEIMVALVIGLLTTMVIFQMVATSEGFKRTTSGGADAQSNSAVGLYLLERDIRQAGYGMAPNLEDYASTPALTNPPNGPLTGGILALCSSVNTYRELAAPLTSYAFNYTNSLFAPVLINPVDAGGVLVFPAGDANTDVIMVSYGASSAIVGKGIDITTNAGTSQPGGDAFDYSATSSRAGINQGDLVLLVPPIGSGLACSIREVTGLPVAAAPTGSQCAPGVTGQINQINNNNVTYKNYYTGCTDKMASWNKPGGSGISYAAGSKLYSLGPVGSFVSRVYAVRGGALTMCDFTANNCTDAAKATDAAVWVPITPGVVGLRAQYGKDNNGDGVIDNWNTTHPVGVERAQVISMRLAIVARSGQYEKTKEDGTEVTTVNPTWVADMSGTANITVDISDSAGTADPTLWQHHRYTLAQTVVPLRNLIWGQQQ